MHIVHKLTKDDPDRKLYFCEVMTEFIKHQSDVENQVVFSDEATFCVNGTVNKPIVVTGQLKSVTGSRKAIQRVLKK